MNVHTSPALLKQRVGTARTYIRPLQADLDVTPQEEAQIDAVRKPKYQCVANGYNYLLQFMEKCLSCGAEYPPDEL